MMDVIINALATLVASFSGAYFAFIFQKHLSRQNEEAIQIANGKYTQFVIIQYIKFLLAAQIRLNQKRDSQSLYEKILPYEFKCNDFSLNLEKLHFIFEKYPIEADIVNQLAECQPAFEKAISSLADYNHLMAQLWHELQTRINNSPANMKRPWVTTIVKFQKILSE